MCKIGSKYEQALNLFRNLFALNAKFSRSKTHKILIIQNKSDRTLCSTCCDRMLKGFFYEINMTEFKVVRNFN
jgi:hypothetical protein